MSDDEAPPAGSVDDSETTLDDTNRSEIPEDTVAVQPPGTIPAFEPEPIERAPETPTATPEPETPATIPATDTVVSGPQPLTLVFEEAAAPVPAAFTQRVAEFQAITGRDIQNGNLDDATKDQLSSVINNGINIYLQSHPEGRITAPDGQLFYLESNGDYFAANAAGLKGDKQGNIKDLENPQIMTYTLLQSVLGGVDGFDGVHDGVDGIEEVTLAEYKDKVLKSIEDQQIERLAQVIPGTDDQRDLLQLVHRSRNLAEVQDSLRTKYQESGADMGQFETFVVALWNLEQRYDAFHLEPDYSGLAEPTSFQEYNTYHSFAAAHDIVGYLTTNEMRSRLDVLRNTSGSDLEERIILDDRLFPPSVYTQLSQQGHVDGALIGREAGTQVSRGEILQMAVARFEEAARNAGITDMTDITRAMFEGRFNPSFDDLNLVYEGMGNATASDIEPDFVRFEIEISFNEFSDDLKGYLREAGVVSTNARGQIVADKNMITPDVVQRLMDEDILISRHLYGPNGRYRDSEWNRRYGGLDDLEPSNTMLYGQEATLTKEDIALRLYQRENARRFEINYGIPRDPSLSYSEVQSQLLARPDGGIALARRLESDINEILENRSAYGYFKTGSSVHNSPFNMRQDYQDLRNSRYIPQLEAGLNTPEPETAPPATPASPEATPETTVPPADPERLEAKTPADRRSEFVSNSDDMTRPPAVPEATPEATPTADMTPG